MIAAALLDAAAAGWVVRLGADDVADADWAAFRTWLDAEPDARAAYDRALDVWLLASRAGAVEPRRLAPFAWAAAAASLAAAIAGVAVLGPRLTPHAEELRTAVAQARVVRLPDGSRVELGPDSDVAVRFGPTRRRVVMVRGDARFDVADARLRPFEVVAGDDAFRAPAAAFDVHRRAGRLRVAVRRGDVAVGPAVGDVGPRVQLPAGAVLDHVEGTQTFQVSPAGDRG